MAPPAALAALPRALARAAFRFANRAEGVPFSFAGAVRSASAVDFPRGLEDSAGVRAAVRAVARQAAPDDADAALDAAIAAVAALHTEVAASIAAARAARARHAAEAAGAEGPGPSSSTSPPVVGFIPPGFIGVHRLYGYRFVVCGHDATCARGDEWAKAVGGDPGGRWYSCLPDEGDCVALFGAARSSKYVAAANVAPAPGAARVTHRALRHFFESFSPSRGAYVPNRRLRFEYPGDYGEDGSDVECIEGDAAVLFSDPPTPQDGLAAGKEGGGV